MRKGVMISIDDFNTYQLQLALHHIMVNTKITIRIHKMKKRCS